MSNDSILGSLKQRIEELKDQEESYWADEFYSFEALTNPEYRQVLEKSFNLDPLGPLPERQAD